MTTKTTKKSAARAGKSGGGRRAEALKERARAEKQLLGSWSRRRLAVKVGLHPSYISRMLRGERQPMLHAAVKIAKILRITVDEFDRRLTAVTRIKAA